MSSSPSELAMQLRGVGKRYKRGDTARLSIPGRQNSGRDTFWALRDIDLEIPKTQRMGIVGANGAGKSTLLKLLSRITRPSAGEIKIWGRLSSLLEVGAGFHPELTGRENVYLNGAILGMRRREVTAAFDDIVAFAGVSAAIDTPVKRYSSGMHVRLAFSVAAHLQAEVLCVDEVLAVGDHAFQKRCIQRMSEIGAAGRTVVFVSHDMNAVARLCDRCIWIDGGRIREDGSCSDVIAAYLRASTEATAAEMAAPRDGPLRAIDVTSAAGPDQPTLPAGSDVTVTLRVVPPGERRLGGRVGRDQCRRWIGPLRGAVHRHPRCEDRSPLHGAVHDPRRHPAARHLRGGCRAASDQRLAQRDPRSRLCRIRRGRPRHPRRAHAAGPRRLAGPLGGGR